MRHVLVTGAAGAGKSWLVRELASQYTSVGRRVRIVEDEQAFFAARQEDVRHAHHTHPWGDERFRHTDAHPFDASVTRLFEAVKAASHDREAFVIAELARGQAHSACDVSHRRALSLAPRLFACARLIAYVHAPWAIRWQRNEERLAGGVGTPRDVMQEPYRDDDFAEMATEHRWTAVTLENGAAGIAATDRERLLSALEGETAR